MLKKKKKKKCPQHSDLAEGRSVNSEPVTREGELETCGQLQAAAQHCGAGVPTSVPPARGREVHRDAPSDR